MSYVMRSFVGPEALDATTDGVLFGLAIPYNKVTTIGDMAHGGFREQIAPGACSKSLREADIVALWNHSSEHPLGRTSAGNLELKNTARGVEPTLRPIPTTYANDLALLVKGHVVRGWSFGFEVVKDDWLDDDGKPSNEWVGTQRTIREMKLIEVSPVTFPAYDMTEISARDTLLREREIRSQQMNKNRTDIPKAQNLATEAASLLVSIYNVLLPEQLETLPEELRERIEREVKKPHGDVPYADPGYLDADGNPAKGGNGVARYPIDESHVMAAWSYINQAKNAGQYTPAQLASIKGKIKSAMAKFGHDVSDEKAQLIKVKRYDPITGEVTKRHDATVARCDRCGNRLTCSKCSIDIGENNDTPEGGTPDADDDVNSPSNETTASKKLAKAIKRSKKVLRDVPDPADLAKSPDKLDALKASAKQTLGAIKAAKKLADKQADAADAANDSAKDDAGPVMNKGTVKRLPQINAALTQALTMFGAADANSLPDDVKTAIGLVSSAATHASHIMEHQGLTSSDAISDNDKAGRSKRAKRDGDADAADGDGYIDDDDDDGDGSLACNVCQNPNDSDADFCSSCGAALGGRRSQTPATNKRATPKPDKSTSANIPDDDALRLSRFEALSRELALGL